MSSASAMTSPSTQPPDTEPSKRPSGATTICPPTPTGAEPHVPTTVARAMRPSLSSQLLAASRTSWALARWSVVGGSDIGCSAFCSCLGQTPAHRIGVMKISGTGLVRQCRCQCVISVRDERPQGSGSGACQALLEKVEDGLAGRLARAVVQRVDLLVGLLRGV